MINPLSVFLPKKMLGIDIGTSAIKLVEISRWGQGKTLENYAEIKSTFVSKDPANGQQKGSTLISSGIIAKVIKAMMQEAKIKTKGVTFSIPDFYTFCTSFEIPPMPEAEVPGAVHFTASQYLTLPITEVTLDWKIISPPGGQNAPMKIFLIAIPNQVIQEYKTIAKLAGLNLYALEAEVLALMKGVIRGNKKTICIMDIGAQSSTVNIVDNGMLKRSFSFDFYSGRLLEGLALALGVDVSKAEEIKNTEGIISSRQGVAEVLYPLINPLVAEVKIIAGEFYQAEHKEVEEVYITGGTANLPGLKQYFAESLKKNIVIPNCFSDLLYPPVLEESLREMAPSFSIATGVALNGLET